MPNKKVLSGQAREMIYDVSCYIRKETADVVAKLRLLKNMSAHSTATLQKKLASPVEYLRLLAKRSKNVAEISAINEICDKLESIRVETERASRASEDILQNIISSLRQEQMRTALATNTSVMTVRRISALAGKHDVALFKTPEKRKQQARPITDMENMNQGAFRRCIINFYATEKKPPTTETLRRKLHKDLNYGGSHTSLRRILKDLRFRWKETDSNRNILIESTNIRLQRIEYLEKIKKYREEGRTIVYTGVSYVDSSHWSPPAVSTKGPKTQFFKRERVVIAHAGSETGFVPKALLIFKAEGETRDNRAVSYKTYENWLRTQLIPNIPPNSVVVVDDVYQNENDQLVLKSKKTLQAWLSEKGIEHDEKLLKAQLLELINKEDLKTLPIDMILAEHNHEILRLPSNHPDLNPIAMAWPAIRQHIGSSEVKWNLDNAIYLVKGKVDSMEAREWKIWCDTTKSIEEAYEKCDHVVDEMTDNFGTRDDKGSESEQTDEESKDDDDEDDEEEDASEMFDDEKPSTSHLRPQPSSTLRPPHEIKH